MAAFRVCLEIKKKLKMDSHSLINASAETVYIHHLI